MSEVLQGLLQYNASERLTFEEICNCDWLKGISPSDGEEKLKDVTETAIQWTSDVMRVTPEHIQSVIESNVLCSVNTFYSLAYLNVVHNGETYNSYKNKSLDSQVNDNEEPCAAKALKPTNVTKSDIIRPKGRNVRGLSLSLGPRKALNNTSEQSPKVATATVTSSMQPIDEQTVLHASASVATERVNYQEINPFPFGEESDDSKKENSPVEDRQNEESRNRTEQNLAVGGRRKSVDFGNLAMLRDKDKAANTRNKSVTQMPLGSASTSGGPRDSLTNFFSSLIRLTKPSNTDINQASVPEIVGKSFSVSTTTNTSPDEIVRCVIDILEKSDLVFKQFGYTFKIKKKDITGRTILGFKLTVCRLRDLNMTGIKFSRFKGDTWLYKEKCQQILKDMNLLYE